MRARSRPTVVHFSDPDAARALLARTREAGVRAVAFADGALDAIPEAQVAQRVAARDEAARMLRLEVGGDVLELVPEELGLVVAGRVMEDGPEPHHITPAPRARGYRGAALEVVGAALDTLRTGPAAEHATPERRLVVDLHVGDAAPIRLVETQTHVTGPAFPEMPRQAALAALVRWLEQGEQPPPIDRGYDEIVRFTEFAAPAQRLGFDLYSARARLVESLRVKHGF